MAIVPPEILEWRKRSGADQYDEMWEGVLHLVAAPNREHQNFEWLLETYLRLRWARPKGCKVYHQINVAAPGGWPNDYRIPDLVLLTPERSSIDRNEYFEGAPEVVVEIRSQGDESYEKLTFYARIGVPEVWVIDRDSRAPEIYRLSESGYRSLENGPEGWLASESVSIELRQTDSCKLAIRLQGQEDTREDLPD